MTFVPALLHEELWIGEMRGLDLQNRRVLVLKLAEGVRAYEDRCAHLGVRLSEGTLAGSVLTCRAHQYQYDALTGEGLNPKNCRLTRLPVRIEGDEVLISLTPEPEPEEVGGG